MKIAVITNCTATSTMAPDPRLMGDKLPRGLDLAEALGVWTKAIEEAHLDSKVKATPAALYRGQGFFEVTLLVDALRVAGHDPDLYIISLGFGLVKSDQEIVSYNINVWKGDDPSSLFNIVTAEPFKPQRWWTGINREVQGKGSPISEIGKGYDMILIAATGQFLDLIIDDVLNTPKEDLAKLRIMSSARSGYIQPKRRQLDALGCVIRYDQRLNTLIPGNRNSFAQRAGTHFVNCGLELDVSEANELVQEALSQVAPEAPRKKRTRMSLDRGKALEIIEECKGRKMSESEALAAVESRLGVRIPAAGFNVLWGAPVKMTAPDKERALAALQGALTSPTKTLSNEALRGIRIFVETVKAHYPDAAFTAKDISTWAVKYYEGEGMPEVLKNPKSISRALMTVGPIIGVVPQDKTSSYGVAKYELAK